MRISRGVLVAAAALLGGGGVAVAAASASPPVPVTSSVAAVKVVSPRVTRTGVCQGVLVVRFDTQVLDGHVWRALMDDGRAKLEVHETETGRWVGSVTRSGGEHVLRWEHYRAEGRRVDLVRVVAGGYRSPGAPTGEPC